MTRRRTTGRLLGAAGLVAALALGGCSSVPDGSAEDLDALRDRVRAAAEADRPPGPAVNLGTADLMPPTPARRGAALVGLDDPDQVAELVDLLDESMSDETSSWHLGQDGAWTRHAQGDQGPLRDLQSVLISRPRRRLGASR